LFAENALEEALAAHETLKAAVDVFRVEKPGDKALAKFGDRVALTPHIGGNSIEAQLEIAEMAADTVIAALTENKLRNLVNFVKIPEDLKRAYLDLAEALGRTASGFLAGKGQLEELRITCYGALGPHSAILVKPAIQGALSEFVAGNITLINAESKAKEHGLKVLLRDPDNTKGYGQSITVDAAVNRGKHTEEISVRGKLIEGEPAIVRIDTFQELGFIPQGHNVFFIYKDKPGVIGAIASALGQESVNIESILARTDATGKRQLLVIKTGQAVEPALLVKLSAAAEAKAEVKMELAISLGF
jgi:D-3-phosphoglycerate dehydrogenase / 2-oxoglutarate reductase